MNLKLINRILIQRTKQNLKFTRDFRKRLQQFPDSTFGGKETLDAISRKAKKIIHSNINERAGVPVRGKIKKTATGRLMFIRKNGKIIPIRKKR